MSFLVDDVFNFSEHPGFTDPPKSGFDVEGMFESGMTLPERKEAL